MRRFAIGCAILCFVSGPIFIGFAIALNKLEFGVGGGAMILLGAAFIFNLGRQRPTS